MFAQIPGWLLSIITFATQGSRVRRSLLFVETLEARVVPTPMAYYVDSARGNDMNDGSQASPWLTAPRVVTKPDGTTPQQYGSGDSITFVNNGQSYNVYTGLVLNSSNLYQSLGYTSPVTITSIPASGQSGPATLYTSSILPWASGIEIQDAGNVTITNLTFQGAFTPHTIYQLGVNYYEAGVRLLNDTGSQQFSNITIGDPNATNVTMRNYAGSGIAVDVQSGMNYQYSNIKIQNTEIFSILGSGVTVFEEQPDPSNPVPYRTIQKVYVNNVYVHHDLHAPDYSSGYGVYLQNVSNGVVEHCTFYHNDMTTHSGGGFSAIVGYFATSLLFQYNTAMDGYEDSTSTPDVDGDGYDFDRDTQNSVMQYNYSEGNAGAGFVLSQPFGDQTPNSGNIIRFNISQDDGRRNQVNGGILLSPGGSATGSALISDAQIYNNTVYMSDPNNYAANRYVTAAFVVQEGVTPSGVKVYNNIFSVRSSILAIDELDAVYVRSTTDGIDFEANDYYNYTNVTGVINWISPLYNSQMPVSVATWATSTANQESIYISLGYQPLQTDPAIPNSDMGPTMPSTNLLHDAFTDYLLSPLSSMARAGLNLNNSSYGIRWDPYNYGVPGSPLYPYFNEKSNGTFSDSPTDYFVNAPPDGNWNIGGDQSQRR